MICLCIVIYPCVKASVNTSAHDVVDVVTIVRNWQYTGEVIQERNRLNVLFVANYLQRC